MTPVRLSMILDDVTVGGAEVMLLNLARSLDRSVVQPRLLCLRERGAMADDFEAAGVPVTVIGRRGRYDPWTVPRLIRQFRSDGTDGVLVTHLTPAPLTLGRVAAWISGRFSIVAPHGMDNLTYTGRRCLPRHDVATLFLSDALVLVAGPQRDYLRRAEGVGRRPWSRIREVVIHNGIPLPPPPTAAGRRRARVALGVEDNEIAVGIVARLSTVKGHELLFDAVAKLAPHDPQLRVVCIGEGEREQELEGLAETLGIDGVVRFTGLRRDVAELLPGLDIACLTSRYECAPLTVIEAMAAAVPVVATDVGAVPEMITDGVQGFLVGRGDADALADRIALLAADPDLRGRMGAEGRSRAKAAFRIEDTAASYQRLLMSLGGADDDPATRGVRP